VFEGVGIKTKTSCNQQQPARPAATSNNQHKHTVANVIILWVREGVLRKHVKPAVTSSNQQSQLQPATTSTNIMLLNHLVTENQL
jgi:hypothetical protein